MNDRKYWMHCNKNDEHGFAGSNYQNKNEMKYKKNFSFTNSKYAAEYISF